MNRLALLLIVGTAAAIAGFGCANEGDDLGTLNPIRAPKQAASALKQAYDGAEPGAKSAVAEVEKAFEAKDYEGAVVGLQVLQSQPNRTIEQSQVLNSMMAGMQAELANALERGDPNARKGVEALKRSRAR